MMLKIFIAIIAGIILSAFFIKLLSKIKKPKEKIKKPNFKKIVIKKIKQSNNNTSKLFFLKGSSIKKTKSIFLLEQKLGHALIVGGSGSGKTEKYFKTLLFINTYLNNTENIIVTDLKGDENQLNEFNVYGSLYKEFRGFLESIGYQIYKLDFIPNNWNQKNFSNKYNPLHYIYENRNQKFIIKNLITEFVQQLFPLLDEKDRYWIDTSRNIISSIIEYMIDIDVEKERFNLVNLIYIWNHFDEYVEYYWSKKRKSHFNENNDAIIIMIQKNIQIINSKSFKEVTSTITTELNKFNDLILQTICSYQDFNLEKFYAKKSVLFLVSNNQNENYNILISIILKQIIDYKLHNANKKTLLLLLDEFNNFGKINGFENYLDTTRSKNIFFAIGIQSITKFEYRYGNIEKYANNFLISYLFGTTSNQNEIDYFNNYYHAKEKLNKSFDAKGNFKSVSKTTTKDKIIDDNALKINTNNLVWIKERGQSLYGTKLDYFSKAHDRFYVSKDEPKMEFKEIKISPLFKKAFIQKNQLDLKEQTQILNRINFILKTKTTISGQERDALRKQLEKMINKENWYEQIMKNINKTNLANDIKESIIDNLY